MADQEDDLPSEDGVEELDTSVEQDEQPKVDAIEALASELGWAPKEQYRGDPDKWKPADQFIRDGREIQQSTARELRSLREQVERFGGVTTQLLNDKASERDAYWQSQFNQAVEDGDTERANTLVKQRPSSPQQQGAAPSEVVDWIARNPWYNSDPLAQARAYEICERLKHLPIEEQLKQAERGIRKEFPEHFPAPAKQPPGVQTGQSRKAAPSNRAKGFAEMPPESQAMARDMVRRNPGLTIEAIAKSYWQQETTKGVSR